MGNIACALESGALAPLMHHKWQEYLRSDNRGEHAPAPGTIPKESDFSFVENMIDRHFPIKWHGQRIQDIFLPESFEVPSSETIQLLHHFRYFYIYFPLIELV